MVPIGDKKTTRRTARAQAVVCFPPGWLQRIDAETLETEKGPIAHTAILAGILAAKKTGDLIPLCHTIALNHCHLDVTLRNDSEISIESRVEADHHTGVEMEALTAVSIAALTVYDMCKALGHDIQITDIRLLEKTGGKKTYRLNAP